MTTVNARIQCNKTKVPMKGVVQIEMKKEKTIQLQYILFSINRTQALAFKSGLVI